ncbi:MAG: UDP-N-acetylmuramoyl-tripeptide--D-alanyl-D-alanine ligase [Nitrospirae bacterium]|nr:UDP-N-acetylmuramoyl-tripeptide--D-alanyl-D-alanine ligase [Nitrospirota bacterium]
MIGVAQPPEWRVAEAALTVMRTAVRPGFALSELIALLGAERLAGPVVPDDAGRLEALSTDTRTLQPGDYFLALKGERFDAHAFVADAFARGAGGAIVECEAGRRLLAGHLTSRGITRPLLGVADPLRALQQLATAHRRRFTLPVIGITGSNGKTTTKEMTASILSRRRAVLKTRGNLNSQIGLPMMLLGLTPEHEAAVLELGISRAGELTRLCEQARPTIGIITNIAPAHLETLGDLDGVRAAKSELLAGLPADGLAVLNRDDPSYGWLRQRCRCRVVGFGGSPEADVRGVVLRIEQGEPPRQRITVQWAEGSVEASLPVIGPHFALNAAAAVAAALEAGATPAELIEGLERVQLPALRSEVKTLPGGGRLLLDAYNANPFSVRRALEAAAQLAGDGAVIAVLGDMLELGPEAERWHEEIGRYAAGLPVSRLVTVGALAGRMADGAGAAGLAADAIRRCADVADARAVVRRWLDAGEIRPGDVVLVKGSRGMRMERLVDGLAAGPGD